MIALGHADMIGCCLRKKNDILNRKDDDLEGKGNGLL